MIKQFCIKGRHKACNSFNYPGTPTYTLIGKCIAGIPAECIMDDVSGERYQISSFQRISCSHLKGKLYDTVN